MVFCFAEFSIFSGSYPNGKKELHTSPAGRHEFVKSKLFSVNYTAQLVAVLMIHSVIAHEKRFYFFSISSLPFRFAAGSC